MTTGVGAPRPEWDVTRDAEGNPVTLTPEQVRAVWNALAVVESVRRSEGHQSLWEHPQYDLGKSRLLGRMLIDGRPPLVEKPPGYLSARGYHLVEPDLPHWYLGKVFPVTIHTDGSVVLDTERMRQADAD